MPGTNERSKGLRLPLRAKLSAGFVLVTLSGGLIAGLLVDRNVQRTTRGAFEDRLSYEATMLGQMTANALFGDLDPNDTSLNTPVHTLGEAVHTQLAVIAKDGTLVADSLTDDPHGAASQASAPEIAQARVTGSGIGVHDGRLYAARAIIRDGTTLGYARSSVPMSEVDSYVAGVRERIAWGSGFALLAAVILGLILSSRIVKPVQQLSEGARRVGGGDFDHTINVSSRDEIGDLAASFNDMTGSLRRTMRVLDGRNHDMRLVLDNVDQGLLTIDRDGVLSSERSAAVDRWFGPTKPGDRFVDLLARLDARTSANFEIMWGEVIDGFLPLEVNVAQLPKHATRDEQELELSYTPLLDDEKALSKMLIVISDVTARRAAERSEAEQREVACIFEHMTRDKSGLLEFLLDAETQVRILTGAVRAPLVETKRRIHTLKGNSAIYGMQRLSVLCHDIESRMEENDSDLSPDDQATLAKAWTSMSQRLSAFVGDTKQVVIDDDEYSAVLKALFDGTPRTDLARMVGDWRMERASDRLARFGASAKELALRLDKGDIEIDVQRSLLRLPREPWAPFWAAFTHVVRNAVDHGLESAAERVAAGKLTPPGLRLSATQRGSDVTIEVTDNGRGVDWARVAERAKRLEMPFATRDDLVTALFTDGVSTRDEVTQLSGRGVGLAVAKEACERMGGFVSVESEPNKGTTFAFHVPLRARATTFPPPRDTLKPAASARGGAAPASTRTINEKARSAT